MFLLQITDSGKVTTRDKKHIDLDDLSTYIINHILMLVQLATGKLYQGDMKSFGGKVVFIRSSGPVEVGISGQLDVTSRKKMCDATKTQAAALDKAIEVCMKQANQKLLCLQLKDGRVREVENQIRICNTQIDAGNVPAVGKKMELLPKYMSSLKQLVKANTAHQTCESEVCRLQEKKRTAIEDIILAQAHVLENRK